jgi:hypothetical protein
MAFQSVDLVQEEHNFRIKPDRASVFNGEVVVLMLLATNSHPGEDVPMVAGSQVGSA